MMAADEIVAGSLVLVVGPSGAGKDTLITIARDMIGPHDRVSFPRRIITREPSLAEDHDTMMSEEFDDALRRGAFAFWWPAHGLRYALATAVTDDIRKGMTVVCNVSRAIASQLRETYARCKVVYIDAPRELRAERIRARNRNTDGAEESRLDQTVDDHLTADLVIVNVGDPRAGGRTLAQAILAEVHVTNKQPEIQ
jgi:ribose 1,5-bisphosphokinase